MPYDDSTTGRHFDFEWKAAIANRTLQNQGCPYLPKTKIWEGFNDLYTWCVDNYRQDLIEQWSPKNKKAMKEYTYGSSSKVWWLMPYDDLKTGKHFDFEWIQGISERTKGKGCPYLSVPPQAVFIGFNDLYTWCVDNDRQDLIDQWSPKNSKPMQEFTIGSKTQVIWQMPYDDLATGKHFDFEWKQQDRIK